jgi:1-aminocyclopropane-1-carboxylate deaminase
MGNLEQIEMSLAYDANRLIKLDLKPFDIDRSEVYLYLDHLNHPIFSGNKVRKLYGSLKILVNRDVDYLLTIGGNYSNYLYACSFIPELFQKRLVVIVKGHEPKKYGYTLAHLKEKGAHLHFYPRVEIKNNLNKILTTLKNLYPKSLYLPEGGSNEWAHKGFKDLITQQFLDFDIVCVPVGTLGTYNGIAHYLSDSKKMRGYAAHQDFSLQNLGNLIYDYAFGGFAKTNEELISFVKEFEHNYNILLDPIYTSKMMYGIIQDLKKGILSPDQKIIAIHTGGLQGWNGFVRT